MPLPPQPKVNTSAVVSNIKVRCPLELFDMAVEMPKLLKRGNFGLGDVFTLQFVNHDETELFAHGMFVVTMAKDVLETTGQGSYSPRTGQSHHAEAEQIGTWLIPARARVAEKQEKARAKRAALEET